jgi:hypothetical protein
MLVSVWIAGREWLFFLNGLEVIAKVLNALANRRFVVVF